MSETFFPINDLLRRRFQTVLVVLSLALSLGCALFLVLFTDSVGFTILSVTEDRLTLGLSTVLWRFLAFVGILTLVTLAAIVSFSTSLMMSQRIRDIGLMKAAGCPSDLVFGYFFNELLLVSLTSCVVGVGLGLSAYYGSIYLFSGLGFHVLQQPINFWLVLPVVIVYLVLATIFGVKPIINAARVKPGKALSPEYYLGLSSETGFGGFSSSHFTTRIAIRSLFRRKSANIRVILCCIVAFTLLTVVVAGGIIANQTAASWVEKAIGRETIMIGHRDVCDQYKMLLSKFYETKASSNFNYIKENYLIPEDIINQLDLLPGIENVDTRLIFEDRIREVLGYVIDPETHATVPVGSNREGESLIVGINPEHVVTEWTIDGEFLRANSPDDAVIGDSVAQKMFTSPLSEHVRVLNRTFDIVGVCLDPVNNGKVVYFPLESLKQLTGVYSPNVVFLKIERQNDPTKILDDIMICVNSANPDFAIVRLDEFMDESLGFLGYLWSTIMLLPLLTLGAAALCLTNHVILTLDDQRQEFGVMRAVGARPRAIVKIIACQNLLVLLSSYGVSVSAGIILTLLILVQRPILTSNIILEIAAWLLIAVIVIFTISVYPAFRFCRKPIVKIMS